MYESALEANESMGGLGMRMNKPCYKDNFVLTTASGKPSQNEENLVLNGPILKL